MSSSDWDLSAMRPPVLRDNHHQHSMSANMAPFYANRTNIPSYYSTGEGSVPQGSNNYNNSLTAPLYSPNLQPWRRQHSHGSLSFVPSPRPEQSEYTTSQQPRRPDRAPVCISPFRSVSRMKQPFQLMLPTSPSCENGSSSKRESRASRQISGSHPLRTWRSDHNLLHSSFETFGLLPSPPLSDSRTSHPSSSSAYFSPKPDSDTEKDVEATKACGCIPVKLCESCNVSKPETREERQNKTGGITNVHMAHSTLVKQYEDASESKSTPPFTATETATASPSIGTTEDDVSDAPANSQRTRAGTVSSQASWVPDNFSYCQNWLQGVETMDVKDEKSKELSRRKFQIVQVEAKVTPSPPPDVKDVVSTCPRKLSLNLTDLIYRS